MAMTTASIHGSECVARGDSVAGSAASRLSRYRTAVRTLPVSVPSACAQQCTTRPGTRRAARARTGCSFVPSESGQVAAARPSSSTIQQTDIDPMGHPD